MHILGNKLHIENISPRLNPLRFFLFLDTDTHGRTQTIISADPAEIMVQALQRRADLRQIEIFADKRRLRNGAFRSLSLSAQFLSQTKFSIFREAMTFFIRLCQPNKRSV